MKLLGGNATYYARKYIDNWRFWITMFGVGLALAFYFLFSLNQRQNQEAAAREAASQIARNNEQLRIVRAHADSVATCFNSVKTAPITLGFLRSHYDLIHNSILTTTAAIQVMPDSPLNPARRASLKRMQAALVNYNELKAFVIGGLRSKDECLALAKRYHIDPKPYEQQLRPKKGK